MDRKFVPALQPTLFDVGETSPAAFELFPKVWGLLDSLANPKAKIRLEGIQGLVQLQAARHSPLVAYVLFTCLTDPNMDLRIQVVRELASVLSPDADGRYTPELVYQVLCYHLAGMQAAQIQAVLEAIDNEPDLIQPARYLLKANPHAGSMLVDIVLDRARCIRQRELALELIGLVGYIDVVPSLERMAARIEARRSGQQDFANLAQEPGSENSLLPELWKVLDILKAP